MLSDSSPVLFQQGMHGGRQWHTGSYFKMLEQRIMWLKEMASLEDWYKMPTVKSRKSEALSPTEKATGDCITSQPT